MKNVMNWVFLCLMPLMITIDTAQAQISFAEDFEAFDPANPTALGDADWLIFASVTEPNGTFLYNYGPFAAPNGGPGFSAVASGEAGADQGTQYINIYSDYNNGDHANGNFIEANVFQERIISAADINLDYAFAFDYRLAPDPNTPDLTSPNLAGLQAFVRVIHPTDFFLVDAQTLDVSATDWTAGSITGEIPSEWEGYILQFGFQSIASGYTATGVYYDNLSFEMMEPPVGVVPTMGEWGVLSLGLLLMIFAVAAIRTYSTQTTVLSNS